MSTYCPRVRSHFLKKPSSSYALLKPRVASKYSGHFSYRYVAKYSNISGTLDNIKAPIGQWKSNAAALSHKSSNNVTINSTINKQLHKQYYHLPQDGAPSTGNLPNRRTSQCCLTFPGHLERSSSGPLISPFPCSFCFLLPSCDLKNLKERNNLKLKMTWKPT